MTGPASQALEDGADDAADDAGFGVLLDPLDLHVLLQLVGEALDGQGLEPDAAGAGEGGEEDSVASKDQVADSRDALDLEGDRRLEGADMTGVDAEGLAGGEVFDDDFAGEFEP